VACKTHEANFPLLLRFPQRVCRASRPDKEFGVVVESHAMHLPQVQVIGLQAAKRFFEHAQAERGITAMRAHFGHQEDLFANTLQPLAHPDFGLAQAIFPAVIKEGDSSVDRFVHQVNGRFLVGRIAKVMASESERGDLDIMFAELALWNRSARLRGFLTCWHIHHLQDGIKTRPLAKTKFPATALTSEYPGNSFAEHRVPMQKVQIQKQSAAFAL
jgi:hypothetical protein